VKNKYESPEVSPSEIVRAVVERERERGGEERDHKSNNYASGSWSLILVTYYLTNRHLTRQSPLQSEDDIEKKYALILQKSHLVPAYESANTWHTK